MPLIKVSGLTKVFKTYHRKEGVWGGIQNLFVRKSREIRAVDNITFSINEGEMVGDWEISLESNDPASDFTYNYDWYNYYQGSS